MATKDRRPGEKYTDWIDRLSGTDAHDALMYLWHRGRQEGLPEISHMPGHQCVYVAMRLDGESHNIAEMLAFQQPPMSNTDREFLEGHCNGNQFEGQEFVGDRLRAAAAAAGVDTTGKVYMGGLAAYPGDPAAWVSGRGDVQKVCESRGWGCQGSVNVKIRPEAPQEIGVAPDLVEEHAAAALASHPEPQSVNVAELKEQVKERISPHWAKN